MQELKLQTSADNMHGISHHTSFHFIFFSKSMYKFYENTILVRLFSLYTPEKCFLNNPANLNLWEEVTEP